MTTAISRSGAGATALGYATPAALVPSEFDSAFDAERARFLRRRFIWFCAFSTVVALLWAVPTLVNRLGSTNPPRGQVVELGGLVFDALLNVAGIVWALAVPVNRRSITLLAIGINIACGIADIGHTRWSLQLDWAGTVGGAARAAKSWAIAVPILVFFDHFLACVFIPWTLWECLVPAAATLAAAGAIFGIDAAAGHLTAGSIVPLLFTPLALAPGAAVCWFRHSSFRRTFQWRFESSRYRQIQAELGGARRLLESCLPPPRDAGSVRLHYVYEPMRQIGGDLLFLHPLNGADDGAATSAVILDVTGHGIAAALTVSRLVGELERLFAERPDASPADVLCGLNRYVSLTLARHGIFVTALCLRVHPNRDELEWANGGHPPALLCRAGDGRACERLESTGYILGVVDGEEFEPTLERVAFCAGDAVVAYTDGASEAMDPGGRQLGIEGVAELVRDVAGMASPREWPGQLLHRVAAHRRAAPNDDTLLVTLFRPGGV